ncbi:hypothetical protein Tco_0180650, partial [Tanacetum coccineum]
LEFMHDYKILDSPWAVVFRDKYGMQMIMRFNEIHKFSDGTLQQIDEALDYRVKEFKVNKVNPGLNTRFWTTNDVIKSKQFMFAIQKRLKLRRIFWNLESFVGGRMITSSLIHSEDGNPARANIKQALGLHKDGDADASFHFRNSDKYYHDPEECEYAGPKVTTSHEGNIPQQG